MSIRCFFCGRSGHLTCAGCRESVYCSAACQKKDWKFHKGSCEGRTTAFFEVGDDLVLVFRGKLAAWLERFQRAAHEDCLIGPLPGEGEVQFFGGCTATELGRGQLLLKLLKNGDAEAQRCLAGHFTLQAQGRGTCRASRYHRFRSACGAEEMESQLFYSASRREALLADLMSAQLASSIPGVFLRKSH